ncbi:MAG: Uma2 family endonuclease, partial [Blastocatellia bacterium]
MSAQPAGKNPSLLAAIKHLPEGGTLTLFDVTWEEYEELLAELGEGYAIRICYDRGKLEITRATAWHEMFKTLALGLARAAAEETDGDLESFGSTTFKRERFAQGVEPDICFYVQNAARVTGQNLREAIEETPPDVVVEIDVSHESTNKFVIYRNLGVPEIWRYDEKRLQILLLTEQGYAEAATSRALPILTADALSQFLEQSKTEGQSAALRSFR